MSFVAVQVNKTWEIGQLDASHGHFSNRKIPMILRETINVDDWQQENPVCYHANCLAEIDSSIIYYNFPG